MKIIQTSNEEEMSAVAMEILLGFMYKDKRVNLAITARSSPRKLYACLAPIVQKRNHFSNVHYFNFDEIPYRMEDREGITMSDLRTMYFSKAKVEDNNIHMLDTTNYEQQDEIIKQSGGLDCMLLGVGIDGHYCGNLPGTTSFGSSTSLVTMDDKIKQRVAKLFKEKKKFLIIM